MMRAALRVALARGFFLAAGAFVAAGAVFTATAFLAATGVLRAAAVATAFSFWPGLTRSSAGRFSRALARRWGSSLAAMKLRTFG
jgi:hypothetical protein